MTDLEFIKRFSKISVSRACRVVKVDRANVVNNKTSKEKIKQVRDILEEELKELLYNGESKDNTL